MGFNIINNIVLGFCIVTVTQCYTVSRTFYLAINEEYWDYSPNIGVKEGLASGDGSKGSHTGSQVFKKAIYREYTDATFTTEKPKPIWLGFLGPTLYAEESEHFAVVLLNNASRKYSLHTHGVLYNKKSEGAPYVDGAHDNSSMNIKDVVEPGGNYTYVYKVVRESSPDKDDPDCLTWLYHSHVDTVKDINSGLVGMLLTCKPGSLNATNNVRHYSLYVSNIDESKSWYDTEHQPAINTKFPMINGFTYGSVPGLDACVGETITWHFAALGTSSDIHALSISGHSFEYFHRRQHSINVNTAAFATATTTSHKPGNWFISCNVNNQVKSGMYAYLHVRKCPSLLLKSRHITRVRWHYIAAEEVVWNYGPTGRNGVDGESLTESGRSSEQYFKKSPISIGGTYKKAVFRAYDDYHFKKKKIQDGRPEHLGILGPVIRAEVGDLIQIVFKNKASRPYSLHAEGVMFSKRSEGMSYKDGDGSQYVSDNSVAPGKTYTYFWYIPEDMAPTEYDPQCLTRIYTSGVDKIKDTESGLIGPLLICKTGSLDPHQQQKGVDKEFILLLSVFNENESWYLDENMALSGVHFSLKNNNQFQDRNMRHSINGLMYGNLAGLDMCVGESVAWHVLTVGSTSDVHTLYFHGNTFSQLHTRHSTVGLLPGDRRTLYMTPDTPGRWQLDCATNKHPGRGEVTLYTVSACRGKSKSAGSTLIPRGRNRIFYIQAEEVEWDYAPSGRDVIYNTELPSKYKNIKFSKILYRGYTSDNFKTPLNRTGEEYLGLLGPVIRTEVGDTLKIVFRNKGHRHFSVHASGLVYKGDHSRFDQPSVAPGKTFTYVWRIRETAGPGLHDPNCINAPYYSDVDVQRDTSTGLVGTLVVCRRGTLDKQGRRTDVHRDVSIYYSIIDEGKSWLAEKNMKRFANLPSFTAINGYIFGNQPLPTMFQWETVDWYLMTIGGDKDLHPVHFHGNDVELYEGDVHPGDVSQLWPGVNRIVRMHAINPGKWLYHCHVNAHITTGMEGRYEVIKSPMPPSNIEPRKGRSNV